MKHNVLIRNGHEYNMECVWRFEKNDKTRDSKGELFPYPYGYSKRWPGMDEFIDRLETVNKFLDVKNYYELYETSKNCLLCHKTNINTKRYILKNTIWEDGLIHYIKYHNVEPSLNFKRFIYHNNMSKNINISRHSKKDKTLILKMVKKLNTEYVIIERNQMLILDALMIHGGYIKKYFDIDINNSRYSEHAGLLDFDGESLSKIIVSGKTNRIDAGDDEIYLPVGIDEMFDYEYIFHTHPPTPKPGGRAPDGVLYEFPSIGDIYHFIDHHNDGNVIGSLVVTAEGLYNIRRTSKFIEKINVDEDILYKRYWQTFNKIQKDAIEKYGTKFSSNTFYSHIAQDMSYIKRFNQILNEFNIQVDFYPRKKDRTGKWYIDTVFLIFSDK